MTRVPAVPVRREIDRLVDDDDVEKIGELPQVKNAFCMELN